MVLDQNNPAPSVPELDLAASDAPEQASAAMSSPIRAVPYDPSRDRERIRGNVAVVLVWLLVGMTVVVVGGIFFGKIVADDLAKIAAAIFSPIIVLLGVGLGFYFGENSRDRTG